MYCNFKGPIIRISLEYFVVLPGRHEEDLCREFLKDSERAECLEAQKGPEGSKVQKVKEVQ